jgi:hypothetical protein
MFPNSHTTDTFCCGNLFITATVRISHAKDTLVLLRKARSHIFFNVSEAFVLS